MRRAATFEEAKTLIADGRLRVSRDGVIESRRQGGPLRVRKIELVNSPTHRLKYARVSFGEGLRTLVHRLVWWAWVGEVPHDLEIDHIDGDKLNNRLENLELVTRAENIRRALAIGLNSAPPVTRGVDEETARAIRRRVDAGETQRAVATALGITPNIVNRIVRGRTYRAVI